ncbi:fumarate reductase subunit FrdD [Halomonas dongshanensis]|uniref:Fumarate reductase subunit D n=1 Tax=Halomonas dongshanensis TaxID=2890835 RepID=A0ABT2EHB6_9GAMM|nr:fumarate reductase subunit FrdD [Halomonas dongshanensis]MCS2610996.1 fumarate reductase subunit D [Halomonas dongshanensis]
MSQPRPSSRQAFDEPLWWLLFSAGGVCFAVLLPATILFFGVLAPLGLLPSNAITAERMTALVFSLPDLAAIGALICLPLFHAAHRCRHGLLDLRLGNDGINKWFMYGLAALLSFAALSLVALGLWR